MNADLQTTHRTTLSDQNISQERKVWKCSPNLQTSEVTEKVNERTEDS